MQFVAQQLGKCATGIERLTAAQVRTDGMIRNLVDVSLSLANRLQERDDRLDRLGKQTDERLNRLAEAQEWSDGKLDALIDIVDKLVRRNEGGSPPS